MGRKFCCGVTAPNRKGGVHVEGKPVWVSEASCAEETSSGSDERVGRGCP